jgi:hypothetical protein
MPSDWLSSSTETASSGRLSDRRATMVEVCDRGEASREGRRCGNAEARAWTGAQMNPSFGPGGGFIMSRRGDGVRRDGSEGASQRFMDRGITGGDHVCRGLAVAVRWRLKERSGWAHHEAQRHFGSELTDGVILREAGEAEVVRAVARTAVGTWRIDLQMRFSRELKRPSLISGGLESRRSLLGKGGARPPPGRLSRLVRSESRVAVASDACLS